MPGGGGTPAGSIMTPWNSSCEAYCTWQPFWPSWMSKSCSVWCATAALADRAGGEKAPVRGGVLVPGWRQVMRWMGWCRVWPRKAWQWLYIKGESAKTHPPKSLQYFHTQIYCVRKLKPLQNVPLIYTIYCKSFSFLAETVSNTWRSCFCWLTL